MFCPRSILGLPQCNGLLLLLAMRFVHKNIDTFSGKVLKIYHVLSFLFL